MSDVRFDGRVAIVTGAGGGLGRVYALELAKRGAKVVVNDLGGSMRGDGGGSTRAADRVVDEIQKAGGTAVPSYDSVVEGKKIVDVAVKAFGTVDIVINNAGILRDVSFHKMSPQDWKLLVDVHLNGTFAVTHAAWPIMRQKKYGRIIMVTSAAGLYGNFGQTHYSAVKMGICGLANTLAKEGKKRNIFVNTIAPVAGSRMTKTVLPPDMVAALKPDYVAPLVLQLVSEGAKDTGGIFEVGAGWISKLRWQRSNGHAFAVRNSKGEQRELSIEQVAEKWGHVTDFDQGSPEYPNGSQSAFARIMSNMEGNTSDDSSSSSSAEKKGSGSKGLVKVKDGHVDLDNVVGYEIPAGEVSYEEKDVILYALGIGAGYDPRKTHELQYVYEGHDSFSVIPSFGVVVPSEVLSGVMQVPGLKFNPMKLLHGEQYMEVRSEIPTSGTLVNKARIAHCYDKGKGALVILEAISTDKATGKEVFFNRFSLFIRGIGGFGGDSGPKSKPVNPPVDTPPEVVHRERTNRSQAALYRLSGDRNPLHIDGSMAKMGGFNEPILHGLCTYGFAVRAVLQHYCSGENGGKFRAVNARFTRHVFPGETLITEMWRDPSDPYRIIFRVKVAERGEYVLRNGYVDLVKPAKKQGGGDASGGSGSTLAGAQRTTGSGNFAAQAIFKELRARVTNAIVGKVNACFAFDLTDGSGNSRTWIADLRKKSKLSEPDRVGEVEAGKGKADCRIQMADADFVKLMGGKLNPQQAFMKGQLKLKGNLMLAQKLQVLQKEKSKL